MNLYLQPFIIDLAGPLFFFDNYSSSGTAPVTSRFYFGVQAASCYTKVP